MTVCNLVGNIYNKAYRSILGIIMMSNDGRICFIVVPDKNNLVCCSKYNFGDFMAAILNFMFYKKSTRMRAPNPSRYHHRGISQAQSKQKKISAKTLLTTVSLRYPVVFAYICINVDLQYCFIKTNEIIGFLIPENIRIDILCL